MTDELPAYVPDKGELKDTLSMHWVAHKLGIHLDENGEAICPFHEDTRPSFYIFDGDDGVQRWWCQPCGRGGDIFSLIQESEGIGFNEALTRATEMLAELPPGFEAPTRRTRERPDQGDWLIDTNRELTAAQQRAAAPNQAGILAVLIGLATTDQPEAAQTWDAYLRGTWGLGVDLNGTILVPHWQADGTLEGIKLRLSGGRKESLPYSKYEYLYGAHLGRRAKTAIITEGESDAWVAGMLAAREHISIDVFAMPSGAQQEIQRNWLDTLRGAKIIYLALDPDIHGVEATRRWIEELDEAGFTDVRVCCLPLGRDLRAAEPLLSNLLRNARAPLAPPGDLRADPGGFVRMNAKGDWYPVTTWSVDPSAQLTGGDDPGFDAILTSRGVDAKTIIRLADLANVQSLNKWANRHDEIFTGSDADRMKIAERVKARGSLTPEVFQTDRVGLHAPPPDYHFAGGTVVLPTDYIGKLPWRYAPTNRSANVTDRILLPAPGDFPWRALQAFIKMSDPSVTHPLLAWAVASARRPEVREFPLLFVGGSSGVGKSTLARQTIKLMGSAIEIDLGANTPFILYRTLSCSSSLPVFVDEWTRLSREDTRQAFQGIVPLLYTGGVAERGMADLNTMGYRVSAPTIIAGEDTFALDREVERTVAVFPSRAAQNVKANTFIQAMPTERFGHGLHHWLAAHPEQLPPMPQSAPNRVDYNRDILQAGWATLRAYLDYCAHHSEDVPDVSEYPDLSCFEHEQLEARENVYMTALVEGSAMSDQNGAAVVWPDPSGRGTWVRLSILYGLIETRRLDLQLPGRSRAMGSYFAERYGPLRQAQVTPPMGMKPIRAHMIPGLLLGEEEEEGTSA